MTTARIFIVEDEKIIAKGIEKRLKGLGYVVAGLAATGEEAVRQAADLHPDLVLMDINLGSGIDGVEAARQIREQIKVPIVFLTAHSDDATLQRAKLTEPHGYILKPYEDKDLQIAIEIGLHKHKMDRLLQENEQWLTATLGSIGDGVIATDGRGRIRFMNRLAEQLTGWSETEAFGRDLRGVFHIVNQKTREPVANPALEALKTGEPTTLTPNTILIDKNGTERPIDDCAAPIRDASGTVSGAVLVFRDITERLRLEDHLRQASKMEAIGRLAGGIAHDFNNIMTIITGFSELLVAHAKLEPDHREFVISINEAGKRAATLTRQIMAFSRKQILVPCVLNLNTILRTMAAVIRRQIGPNIQFVTELAPNLGSVKADPTQVEQVLLNLVTNARDAMPKGGRLVISTINAELSPEAVAQHPDVPPGRYAMLAVADTGCGMRDEVLARIFEPFFTTKEVGKGTGLGLASVYGIVKQSGGHIDVSSTVGVGTTFRVYLPMAEGQTQPVSRVVSPAATEHKTILLFEEEETVRRMTKMVLEREGYTVLQAKHTLDAISAARQHNGPIDLLMADLALPHLSGREIADQLRSEGRVSRVLFMSGHTEDVAVYQVVEAAEADLLQKPFDIAEMILQVREILARV